MRKVSNSRPLIGAFLFFSFALFFPDGSVSAQSSSKHGAERLELLPGAGSLFHTEVRGEEVTWVIGNVHFRQGEGDFRADSARWHQKTNRVVLVRKVKIRYPDYQLAADSVRYDAKTKEGWAYGHIRYEDLKEKTVLLGERGRYEREKKYLLIDQKPEMQLLPSASDTAKPETTFVWARKLEFFGDEEKGIGTDSVRIRRGKVFAYSQKAEFLRKEEKLFLTEKPRGGDDKSEVAGERLTLHFKNNRVQRLTAEKKAKAVYRDLADTARTDTTRSELAADSITFHFEGDSPALIRALGQAYIYYNQADGKVKNHASGDSVHLHLKDRRVDNVSIHGGGQGTYYAFPESKPGGDTVYYQAEEIEYQIPPNKIFLLSRAEARYQNLTLEADSMLYDGKAELLFASGFADTSRNTTKRILKDGKDEVAYDRLAYDFNTKKGKMKSSRTQLVEGYYRGADVSRVSEEEVFIKNGWFTTCDAEHPHYYFSSSHMKLINRNRMIARPVVLRIADIPLMAIPFYIFPLKPGRHSGILNLRIGNFGNQERGIHNIGYFFALSDYYDLTTAMDVDETGGDLTLLFRSQINYNWRYRFSGRLGGSYSRDRSIARDTAGNFLDSSGNFLKSRSDRWDFNFSHYQTLSPTATLSGSGNFVSDKNYYPDRSLDLSTRLNRVLNPYVSLSKNLGWGGLSIVAQKTFNLDTDERTSSFPSVSLTKPAKPFFSPGRGGSRAWYHSIFYGYSGNFLNYYNRVRNTDSSTTDRKRSTANHNFSLSVPQKIFWLTLSPNFNYTENWFHIYRTNGSEAAGVSSGSFRRGSGSVGISSTTNLYGTFLFRLGSLAGLRHVLTPSVSYAWIPKSTRHQKEAAFVGVGVQTQTAQVLNFSLSQLFQAKLQGEKGERKLDLFTATMAASYNAEANFRRWSELTTAVRTSAIPNFSFDFSARHDFYDSLGNGLARPRLLNFSVTSSYNWNRSFSFGPTWTPAGSSAAAGAGGEDNHLPVGFSISHTITQVKQPRPVVTTQQINLNASVGLTKTWQMSYSQSYDLTSKASSYQEVVLTKDLHCWQGYFSWRPSGFRKGYYFTISVKALPELKISKEPVGLGTFLPSTFR
ncbi:MAG: LPS assembly protein LptD [Limisphaerales bacterium]